MRLHSICLISHSTDFIVISSFYNFFSSLLALLCRLVHSLTRCVCASSKLIRTNAVILLLDFIVTFAFSVVHFLRVQMYINPYFTSIRMKSYNFNSSIISGTSDYFVYRISFDFIFVLYTVQSDSHTHSHMISNDKTSYVDQNGKSLK